MSGVNVSIETEINKASQNLLLDSIVKGFKKATVLVHGDAKKNCPIHLGQLRNSIDYKVDEQEPAGIVFSDLDYAPSIEYGTKPHFPPISALKKWALDKLGDENLAYAVQKSIGKKGTPEQPVFRNALYENRDNIVKIIWAEMAKLLRKDK